MEVDGHRAERRLPERPNEDGPGEDLHPAREAGRPQRRDGEHERRQHREERDHPVRELDVRVVALLRERIARLAAGPVLAAEARGGEANGRTRGDDQDEHPHSDAGNLPEALRGDGERASPRERARGGLGLHTASLDALRAQAISTPWPASTEPMRRRKSSRAWNSAWS